MPKPVHDVAGSWAPVWTMIAEAAAALRRQRAEGEGTEQQNKAGSEGAVQ